MEDLMTVKETLQGLLRLLFLGAAENSARHAVRRAACISRSLHLSNGGTYILSLAVLLGRKTFRGKKSSMTNWVSEPCKKGNMREEIPLLKATGERTFYGWPVILPKD